MPKGLWVWPADKEGQAEALRKVAATPHLTAALAAISGSAEGLSNAEVDDAINDSSEWRTLWVVRQLTSLGFIELKVDFFGNPARYHITEQGKLALSTMAGETPPAPPEPVSVQATPPPSPRPPKDAP